MSTSPIRWLCILGVLFLTSTCGRAEWKPGKAPLMTRWGKAVKPDQVWPEYPRPQLERPEWLNLNGLWDYALVAPTATQPAQFDGQILVPFPIESALSGVMKTVAPEQALWYRRTVVIPPRWEKQRILLHFGAVDWDTTVFVNGKEVGKHRGGFDPFSFDITAALLPKEGDKQEIAVRVVDPTDGGAQPRGKQVRQPGGIYYTSVTGIWQTVWLEPVPTASIRRIQPLADLATGTLKLTVHGRGTGAAHTVRAVASAGGKPVGSVEGKVGATLALKIEKPQLWSLDTPFLYDLDVTLWSDGKEIDRATSYFALRSITRGKDKDGIQRLLLNGKPLFQYGPLDQGWWPDGLLTPPSKEAMVYDLKVLKDLGCNMLRKHVKVEPALLYRECDRLGLLVWQDMPSCDLPPARRQKDPDVNTSAGFTDAEKTQFKAELQAMIEHLSFFSCIVVWVPWNEGWGQHDTNAILDWTMQADPSRLVDGPSGWTDRGVGHMKDAHIYPGPGMLPVTPERISVLGEFGGLGLPLEGHLWTDSKNWGYRTFKTREELRDNYRSLVMQLRPLIGKGLSAAVYTQTTDVETEVNGLMTYDREVLKVDLKETAAWHRKLYGPPPELKTLLESAQEKAQAWRYTTTAPAAGWFKSDFDDGKWQTGEAGFGTRETPGTVVRTVWNTKDIWIRRSFKLPAVPEGEVVLSLHHDEDAEIYLNGVLAARVTGYVSSYTQVPLNADGRKALKAGTNVIAIHCRQTQGGQYIDAGLIEVRER